MITLTATDGKAFVWNTDDWLKLREFRILGHFIGCLAHLPYQETFQGFPLELLPEEVTLLLELKVAKLARFPSLSRPPGEGVKIEYEKYREKIYNEQVEILMKQRKEHVVNIIDRIAEGKKRKLLGLSTNKKKNTKNQLPEERKSLNSETSPIIDKDALLQEEFSKIQPVTMVNTLLQIFTVYPWLRVEDACPVKWTFPETSKEKLQYMTYKDLWNRGYFITNGRTFGGEYLVYPGDPEKFHAHFIVICMDRMSPMPVADYIALGRLGTNVHKTVVIATLSQNGEDVSYQSIKWNGKIVR